MNKVGIQYWSDIFKEWIQPESKNKLNRKERRKLKLSNKTRII